MGIEPTNRWAQWAGISIDRIEQGKIVENWVSWDMMGMLQQLGVVSCLRRRAIKTVLLWAWDAHRCWTWAMQTSENLYSTHSGA